MGVLFFFVRQSPGSGYWFCKTRRKRLRIGILYSLPLILIYLDQHRVIKVESSINESEDDEILAEYNDLIADIQKDDEVDRTDRRAKGSINRII